MRDSFEDSFLEDSAVIEPQDTPHLSTTSIPLKCLREQPQPLENRDYFDPFHGQSLSSQLSSPMRTGSPHLDEYSSVAGQYFKDIMIPRVGSRKLRVKSQQEPTEVRSFFPLIFSDHPMLSIASETHG